MDSLERILGSHKFRSLKSLEKSRLLELISANPVYTFLIPGIMNEPNWRLVLGEAYLKYVEFERPAKAALKVEKSSQTTTKVKEAQEIIFGVDATESENFTTSRMM